MTLLACLMTSLLAVASGSTDDADSVTYYVTEELPVGSVVGNVGVDFRLDRRYSRSTMSRIKFELLTQPPGGLLKLEKDSWNVMVAGRIDRESLCEEDRRCILYCTLAVQPHEVFQLLNIEIEVLDVNDHAPMFIGAGPPYRRRHVMESAEIGTQLTVATVRDPDIGRNGLDRYETTTDCSAFDPRPTTRRLLGGAVELRLRLEQDLDRETVGSCTVVLWAMDGGRPAQTASTRVDIVIDDANDNAPIFDAESYEIWIPEDVAVGTCFITVSATDNDDALNAMVTYSLDVVDWNWIHHASGPSQPFHIDPESGTICLQHELDFETQSVFLLPLVAHDKGVESLSGHSSLTVHVEDVNDNAPSIVVEVICGSHANIEVVENNESGLTVALVSVSDLDAGSNGNVVCSLNETSPFQLVEIYKRQFHLTVTSTLDRENREFYPVEIRCHDLGYPPLTSSSVARLQVVDQNDNSPTFSREVYVGSVVENSPRGQSLLQVFAVDHDVGINAEVTYHLQDDPDGMLAIDRDLGIVSTAAELDFETVQLVSATVVAVDRGAPRRSSSAALLLRVTNVDDEPLTFSEPFYHFTVAENQPVGSLVGHVTTYDPDIRPAERNVRFWLAASADSELFDVVKETGALLTSVTLDFEVRQRYCLVVFAADLANRNFTAFSDVTVTVDDVNDHRPRFVFPSPGVENHVTLDVDGRLPVNDVVCTLTAHDDDTGENGRLAFRVVSDHRSDLVRFNLDPVTGQLRLVADHLMVRYVELTMVVQAQDHGVPQLRDTGYLRVIVRSTTSHWQGQRRVRSRSPQLSQPSAASAVTAGAVSCLVTVLAVLGLTLAAVVRRRRTTSQDKPTDCHQTRL